MAIDPKSRLVIINHPKKLVLEDTAKKLVIKGTTKTLVLEDTAKRLVVEDATKRIVVKNETKILAFKAEQGLPGIPGDGENFTCAEDINFGDILYFKPDGFIYKASYNSSDLISDFVPTFFMAQGVGTSGGELFCRLQGRVTFPSGGLIPYSVYYLGENGKITNTPPSSGLMLVVGSAINGSDFFVHFHQPILLRN